MEPLRIVLGLGNPGERYARTRHNLGFRVIDRLAGGRVKLRLAEELDRSAWTAELSLPGGPAVLVKPRTYMNRSGRVAAALCRQYGAGPAEFLVVCDDADLVLGRIRIRNSGSAGGHNGLRSLIDVFGSGGFPRVRLGVRGEGRVEMDLAQYVLAFFTRDEEPIVERLVELGAEAVEFLLEHGLPAAADRYNGLGATAG